MRALAPAFLPHREELGRVAQLVEQGIENPCVGGSIPSPATIKIARKQGFSAIPEVAVFPPVADFFPLFPTRLHRNYTGVLQGRTRRIPVDLFCFAGR
jgi:hypothetical protein